MLIRMMKLQYQELEFLSKLLLPYKYGHINSTHLRHICMSFVANFAQQRRLHALREAYEV